MLKTAAPAQHVLYGYIVGAQIAENNIVMDRLGSLEYWIKDAIDKKLWNYMIKSRLKSPHIHHNKPRSRPRPQPHSVPPLPNPTLPPPTPPPPSMSPTTTHHVLPSILHHHRPPHHADRCVHPIQPPIVCPIRLFRPLDPCI